MNKNNSKASYKDYEAMKNKQYQQTDIDQNKSPPPNVIRASNRFLMLGDNEVGPHVNLANIPGPQ